MIFERPAAWALLALALPIVLLHLRWRRRREAEVSSLAVWRDVAPPGIGRRGMRRIEEAVQLAAVLGAVVLLAAALAGPVVGRGAEPARRLVLVIDVSASMNARAGDGSRFDAARAAAVDSIARLGPGDEVVVWAASARPRVELAPTTDRDGARAALARIEPTLEAGGIATTLRLARSASADVARATYLVLTDAPGAAEPAPDEGGVLLGAVGGASAVNAGFTSGWIDGDDTLRLRVARTDGPPSRRTVVLRRDDVEVARADVDLPEAGEADVALPLGGGSRTTGYVEARLEPPDDFEPDDAVGFVLAPAPRPRVALVAPAREPSQFLLAAIRAQAGDLDPDGIVAATDAPAAALAAADVIVAEGALPPAAAGDRPTVLFGAAGRVVERPLVWGVGEHPVLRGIDLSPLRIDRTAVLDLAPGERSLIECAEGCVAAAGEDGGVRRVRFGFTPAATTLPLEAAFPLLVRNAVRWVVRPPVLPPAVRAGAPLVAAESLPAVDRVWFVGPGDAAARPALVRDGAVVEPVPLPRPSGPRRLRVRGIPGDPETAVHWFAPAGYRLVPAAPRAPGAAEAVAALPDRRANSDDRVALAGWCALAAALLLLLATLQGTSRPSALPPFRSSALPAPVAEAPATRGHFDPVPSVQE